MDDGFFDRFIIDYPERKKDWQLVDRPPDKEARKNMVTLTNMLADADWNELLPRDRTGDGEEYGKPYVKFNDHAQAIFDGWLKNHMAEIAAMDDEDPMAGFIGKQRGLMARMCLIFHLASWAGGEDVDIKYVSDKTLNDVIILFSDYIRPMWERTVAAFAKSKKDDSIQKIAKWIQDEKINRFALWELHRKQWSGLKDDYEIKKAINVLVSNKWLSDERTIKSGPKGGSPWKGWVVNPKVHSRRFTQFSQ